MHQEDGLFSVDVAEAHSQIRVSLLAQTRGEWERAGEYAVRYTLRHVIVGIGRTERRSARQDLVKFAAELLTDSSYADSGLGVDGLANVLADIRELNSAALHRRHRRLVPARERSGSRGTPLLSRFSKTERSFGAGLTAADARAGLGVLVDAAWLPWVVLPRPLR